jgi:hypothetical protein
MQINWLISPTQQTMKRKRKEKKGKRIFAKHQSANTVERNTHPKPKTSAGNWTTIQHPAHHCGSILKTPEGAWGPK